MSEQTEKELIIRDLYIMDTFYKNKSDYEKILSKKDIDINEVELRILNENHSVSSEEDIKNVFAMCGNAFDDDYGKDKPSRYVATYSGEIWEKEKIFGFLIGGLVCIGLGLLLFISGYKDLEGFGLGFGGVLLLTGVSGIIAGIAQAYQKHKNDKAYEEAKKKEKECNKLLREWEEKQKNLLEKRNQAISKFYGDELNDAVTQYKKLIFEYNKTKKEHICKIENVLERIEEIKAKSVLPVFYLDNPEAVEKMLFFMLNKRADTVKELVNLYETVKWQDNVLKELSYTNKNLIKQNIAIIEGLIKIDDSLNQIVYDMEHMEFESISVGYLI